MKKIIFIHIPKNCGNSIKRLLTKEKNIILYDKFNNIFQTGKKLSDYEKDEYLDIYYKFAIIRNPWDRLVSYYFHIKRYLEIKINFRRELEVKYGLDISQISNRKIIENLKYLDTLEYSEEFINYLTKKNIIQKRIDEIKLNKLVDINKLNMYKKHNFKSFWNYVIKNKDIQHYNFLKTSQYDYIKSNNEKNMINDIIRFENLNQEFEIVKNKLNLENNLEKFNYTKHKKYQEYYDDEIKEKLLPFLKQDLDKFNYTF